jgi:hypothetical protein
MWIANIIRGVANLIDREPQQQVEQVQPFALPEKEDLPPGSRIVVSAHHHAQTMDRSDMDFDKKEISFRTADNEKYTITLKNNVIAKGCGHQVSSPNDIAFFAYDTNEPVCKACEKELRTLRRLTRDEDCKCLCLVAPQALKPVEGHGWMCPKCLKKHKRLKPIQCLGLLFGIFLKPLVNIENEASNENNTPETSAAEHYSAIQNHPLSRIRDRPPHPRFNGMGAERSSGPDDYQRIERGRY